MGGFLQIRICWIKKCSTLITMSNQYQHYTPLVSQRHDHSAWPWQWRWPPRPPRPPWPPTFDRHVPTSAPAFATVWHAAQIGSRTLYGEERRPLRPLTPDHQPFSFLFATCSIWRVSFCERCQKIVKIFFKHFFFCSVLIFSCPKNWHYIM